MTFPDTALLVKPSVAAQCLIGLGRTSAEAFAPQALDRLDSNTWFEAVTVALDGVAMLGVATSTLTTVKAIQVTTKVTGKPIQQVLKGLTRQERVKLNDELLKIRDPRLTSKLPHHCDGKTSCKHPARNGRHIALQQWSRILNEKK